MILISVEKILLRLGLYGVLLLGVIIPVSGVALIYLFLPGWQLANTELHTYLEALGSFTALFLALLILFIRRHERGLSHRIWIGSGLLAIGLFDGLEATTEPTSSIAWLRCGATLTGGLLFALSWLPERVSRSRAADLLPFVTTCVVGAFCVVAIGFPQLLPTSLEPEGYSDIAKGVNFLGGIFFLAAAVHFERRYRTGLEYEDFLFTSLALLFGISGVMYWFMRIWHADYWFWHLLRLVACIHILYYVFLVYLKTTTQLRELNESLEQRVLDRTEELTREIAERRLAEAEINRYNEELLTINRVVTACTSLRDIREILARVLDETMRIANLEEGSVCLLAPDGTPYLAAHHGGTHAAISHHGAGVEGCCFLSCSEEMKPIILRNRDEVLAYEGEQPTRWADIRFHAAFPLITAREKCVGVLCVFTTTGTKPTERSLRLLETITAPVALLIENARLYEETLNHAAALEKKVTQRTAELEVANRKLREIDRLKSMFIASMSHELRTPLNSVIGFSSILLDEWVGPLNPEQKENLATVLKAGKLLLALINDVIDVSKIEAGLIDINREEFDLSDVVAEAVANLEGEAREKGLELRVENLRRQIYADRRRVLQCLLNLLGNGIRYTEKGVISVRVITLADGCAEISVEDTGIGIRDEEQAKIFEPFIRLESPLRAKVAGTGLGLYLTRKLVTEVLAGELSFTSEYGKGSRFAMTIPANNAAGSKGAENEDPDSRR